MDWLSCSRPWSMFRWLASNWLETYCWSPNNSLESLSANTACLSSRAHVPRVSWINCSLRALFKSGPSSAFSLSSKPFPNHFQFHQEHSLLGSPRQTTDIRRRNLFRQSRSAQWTLQDNRFGTLKSIWLRNNDTIQSKLHESTTKTNHGCNTVCSYPEERLQETHHQETHRHEYLTPIQRARKSLVPKTGGVSSHQLPTVPKTVSASDIPRRKFHRWLMSSSGRNPKHFRGRQAIT